MIIRINKTQLKQELFSLPVLFGGVVTSIAYVAFSTLIFNHILIGETLAGSYTLSDKVGVLLSLLLGVTTLYKPFELTIILLMGFLMGMNLVLLTQSAFLLSKRKTTPSRGVKQKGGISFGLGFLGMLATTGCASCGITLLSFLGPTISLSLFPFQGIFLQGVSLFLLLVSLIHILNRRSQNCIIAQA